MRRDMINNLPAPLPDEPYHIGIVPNSWLPYVLGAIEARKGFWLYEDGEAAKRAYAILSEVQMSFLTNAYKGLTEPVNNVYRLLDTNINGRSYETEVVGGETVVVPEIPLVPYQHPFPLLGELNRLARITGTGLLGNPETDPFVSQEGAVEILQQIRDNIVADDVDLAEIVTSLEQVLLLLA